MKKLLLTTLFLFGCGSEHNVEVDDSEHLVKVVNPVVEFCEKLHPKILFPDEFERQTEIVECLEACTGEDSKCGGIPEELLNGL